MRLYGVNSYRALGQRWLCNKLGVSIPASARRHVGMSVFLDLSRARYARANIAKKPAYLDAGGADPIKQPSRGVRRSAVAAG
jgi:hypothetical protein